ncbi:hypothetical protein CR513_31901, partial [Mucuna pruriens]
MEKKSDEQQKKCKTPKVYDSEEHLSKRKMKRVLDPRWPHGDNAGFVPNHHKKGDWIEVRHLSRKDAAPPYSKHPGRKAPRRSRAPDQATLNNPRQSQHIRVSAQPLPMKCAENHRRSWHD